MNLTTKEVTGKNVPVGATLVAQAMNGGDMSMRYKAMQAVKDWGRTRLAYRAVKRAFYSQIRVGQTHRDGSLSTFRMWKFRSMYKDADERLAELKGQNEIAGAMFKMREDPRVTKIGKFIRKHSIDEFPQFLNVFLGQMSVVGPRPPLLNEVAEYTEYDLQRLAVKPGITGWWQVTDRNDTDFDGMVRRGHRPEDRGAHGRRNDNGGGCLLEASPEIFPMAGC